jgi:glycerophosphoryl diester phosphodiesterase
MTALYIALTVIAVLAVLYVLSVRGRTGHPGLHKLHGWKYAHRGLHSEGIPENSMAAFRASLSKGYGIELDVHLLADGNLAIIHDSLLQRTTGVEGRIEELNTAQLEDIRLEGTDEKIPLFSQVLELYDGKAPLIVELKPLGNNYNALCEKAVAMLDGYKGVYCLESFDPRCLLWLKKHRPDLIRGQLTENYFLSKTSPLPWILKFLLTHQMGNFLTKPDFVAYRCSDRYTFSNTIARKLWKLHGVTWTLKDRQDYDNAIKEGWIPIFEGFEP